VRKFRVMPVVDIGEGVESSIKNIVDVAWGGDQGHKEHLRYATSPRSVFSVYGNDLGRDWALVAAAEEDCLDRRDTPGRKMGAREDRRDKAIVERDRRIPIRLEAENWRHTKRRWGWLLAGDSWVGR